MPEIKEQKEIISGADNTPKILSTSDQIKSYVDQRVDELINDKMSKLQDKIESKIEVKETKTTEMLAIFVTLFTFISVNITIFTKVSDIKRAVFFMLLMIICSIILLSFIFISINDQKKNVFQWVSLLAVISFLVLMLFVFYLIPGWNFSL